MERNLSFHFQYDEDEDDKCPDTVIVTPDPNSVSDAELLLVANTCVQALSTKHGLEQALTMVNDAVYGKLSNGTRFDTKWLDSEETETY